MTGRRFAFTVKFAAGKQRHRLDRRHARVYTPNGRGGAGGASAGACREGLAEASIQPLPFGPHEPVILDVDAYRPLPESRPKRVYSEPDTYRPDADNESKLVMDALNGLVWADDAQVVDLHVVKHPRVRGQAERMDISIAPGWSGHRNETEEM